MGKLPLYSGQIEHKGLHKGLLFDKFYEWEKFGGTLKDQNKKGFLEKFKGECGSKSEIEAYVTKQLALIESLCGTAAAYSSQWHFVTGMGIDHPLENGVAWHPTLGVPYLAGSGVKGMLRAYLWEWSDIEKSKILKWCGYTKEEGEKHGLKGESSGCLIFFDAIPIEPVVLTPDVITPHMGDWYDSGGSETHNAKNTPADWHNPNPILFLAVKKATFLFGIAPRNEEAKADIAEAMKYLGEALDFVGAGAKTAAGYGRFASDDKKMEKLINDAKQAKEQAEKKALEQARAQELEKLSPIDRIFAQIGEDTTKLIEMLEKNEFGDDTKEAAVKIKEMMIAKKDWEPNGDPNKNKSAKRTKRVQKILGE